jgi:hypothetical protein
MISPQFSFTGVTNPASKVVVLSDTGTQPSSFGVRPQAAAFPITFYYNAGASNSLTSVYTTSLATLSFLFNEIYQYALENNSASPPASSPAPSTSPTTVPIDTTSALQSLALVGIAPPPAFTFNGLSLTWGAGGSSGGGSGGSTAIGNPTFWINNNPNGTVTPLAGGTGGSVTIQQYGGLPPNGCVPGLTVGTTPSNLALPATNVLYAAELTFTTSGNILYAGNEVYGGLVFVNSGTLPTGTYYALVAQEGHCSPGTGSQAPLVVTSGSTTTPLGQLVPNKPFQGLIGTTSVTTQASTTYVIEIYYQ